MKIVHHSDNKNSVHKPALGTVHAGVKLSKLKFRHFHHERHPHKEQVIGRDEDVEVFGHNYDTENWSHSPVRYVMGIKRGNTLHTVTVPGVFKMRRRPLRPSKQRSDQTLTGQVDDFAPDTQIRQMARRAQYNLKADGAGGASQNALRVQQAIAEAQQDQQDDAESGVDNDTLPSYNLTARKPHQIYDLTHILSLSNPLSKVDVLQSAINNQAKLTELRNLRYPSFVINRLENFKHSADDSKQKELCEKLALLTNLVFLKGLRLELSIQAKKKIIPEWSNSHNINTKLTHKLVEEFYHFDKLKRRYARDFKHQDKLINYILILCLSCNNYEIDPSIIASDLNMKVDKCLIYLKGVGCKISSQKGQGYTAKLKAPLEFPSLRKRKRRN